MNIKEELLKNRDLNYRDFSSRLIPGFDKEYFIGVRLPVLRKMVKKIDHPDDFLKNLPHSCHEENILHVLLLNEEKDYDRAIEKLDAFFPYINNWSVSDTIKIKAFQKKNKELAAQAILWTERKETYTIRVGIDILMTYFLDEKFDESYPEKVAAVKSEEYYVRMMAAWYFATALAKQYDAIIPYLEERKLDEWTHRKTIQKAIESYRIDDEKKVYLRTLK